MTTAHVEVLTAEVRTLMVGSRQVTLSVFKQLDEVPWTQIEAFGRVRTSAATPNRVELVGRSAEGALVRSAVHSSASGPALWFDEVYDGPPWCELVAAGSYSPAGSLRDLQPRLDFRAFLGDWSVAVPPKWQVLIDPRADLSLQ